MTKKMKQYKLKSFLREKIFICCRINWRNENAIDNAEQIATNSYENWKFMIKFQNKTTKYTKITEVPWN